MYTAVNAGIRSAGMTSNVNALLSCLSMASPVRSSSVLPGTGAGGCGRLWYADEPFYHKTRHGVPVVDLVIALSQKYPYHRTAQILEGMGVLLDRGTVRAYARAKERFPQSGFTEMYGFPVPYRIIALSEFIAQDRPVVGAELLAALGLPAAERTSLSSFSPGKQKGDEEEQEEERISKDK